MKPNETTSLFAAEPAANAAAFEAMHGKEAAHSNGAALEKYVDPSRRTTIDRDRPTVANVLAPCILAGVRLGDFILLREIARGGMGVVYEAKQVSLARRVAVKVLPFSAAVADRAIARFKNEAQAAAQIDHPNIVPVFAVGHENGVHYFAMQLIGGQSLASLLLQRRTSSQSQSSPLSSVLDSTGEYINELARIGAQAAEALQAAHEAGIVHRDVKPSNLLLDEKGKLWVTDFGVARCKSSGDLTDTGHVVGSMPYMSPEQALGLTEQVDHRTDIYSLGVTLYELATLRHPCEGASTAVTAPATFRADLRKPRFWNRAIPLEFENIVLKAMAEEREERYASAREMADDLKRFVAGEPILARRPSFGSRVEKWARRNRKPATAAVLALALALIGVTTALGIIANERAEKDAAYRAASAEQARAERRFRHAREVLDRFAARVDQTLAGEAPGAELERRVMLADMLLYYEQFAEEAADDPTLAADLAVAYFKIGELSDQLGSHAEAAKAYRLAQKVWRRLARSQPTQKEHRRHLARCGNNLGQALKACGEPEKAQAELERALRLQREFAEGAESDLAIRGEIATTERSLGLLAVQSGDADRAANHFREAIVIREAILCEEPADEANLRQLAAVFNNLSSLHFDEKPALAGEWLERALVIQLKLVDSHRENWELQSDLALTYNNLGAIHTRLDRWEDAELCFLDAIAIGKRLNSAAPAVASYRCDLAVSWNNLGMMQASAGELDRAEISFQEALALQQKLVEGNPHVVQYVSALGGIRNNLGMIRRGQGRLAEAEKEFHAAIDAQKQALAQAPGMIRFRQSLTRHYDNYAAVLRSLDRPEEAAKIAHTRRELWLDVPLAPKPQSSLGFIDPPSRGGPVSSSGSHPE